MYLQGFVYSYHRLGCIFTLGEPAGSTVLYVCMCMHIWMNCGSKILQLQMCVQK